MHGNENEKKKEDHIVGTHNIADRSPKTDKNHTLHKLFIYLIFDEWIRMALMANHTECVPMFNPIDWNGMECVWYGWMSGNVG